MILEIRKSFDFYIAQPDGMAVDSIILSGGQSQQRNLAAYIEEKLGIPVDVRVAPENGALTIAAGNEDEQPVSYLIAMGLALTGLGLGQTTVDFLPTELKTMREFKKKNVELFLLMGAILAMIGISTQIGEKEMENMRSWLVANQGKIDAYQQTKLQLDKARAEREAINQQVTAMGSALSDRIFWLEFLGMLETVKPGDILVSSVHMNPDGTVDLIGETIVLGSIAVFAKSLAEQKEWISKAEISIPPTERFSQLIKQPVTQFGLRIETHWKKTRLAPARVTLSPGVYTPSAPPPGAVTPAVGPGAEEVI